jgi:fatty acid desaturase
LLGRLPDKTATPYTNVIMAVMAQKLAGFAPLPEKARTLPQNVRASSDKDRTPPEKTSPLPEPTAELAEPIFTPPDYTMKEIYAAIPEHCLHPSTFWSVFYVLRDVAMILALFYAATFIEYVPEKWMRNLLWVSYSIVQGFVFTGIWELAHEAGHGALSENKFINHTMGLLIHSALLVPYHSWRFTHSYHHKSTNNLDGDVAFVPDRKEDWEKKRENRWKIQDWTEDMPIVALLTLIIHQIVAWPLYLTINNFALKRIAAAPWWKRSHFYWRGDGPEFRPENTREVIISNCAILVMVGILWAAVKQFGGWNVMRYYGFPYMWENHWIRKFPPPPIFSETMQLANGE